MSVGHVGRALEESGIATVTVMVKAFEHRAREMNMPRALIVKHPMGRPMGAAGDTERQHEILRAAFDLASSATDNGAVVEFPKAFRPRPLDA